MKTSTFLSHHQSGHYRYREPFRTSRSNPVDFLVIWVTSGNMDVTLNAGPVPARQGDLVLLGPGVPHLYVPRVGGDWEWFWLHFDGAGAPQLWSRLVGGTAAPVRFLGLDAQIRARFVELVTAAAGATGEGESIRVDTCTCSLLGLMVERLESHSELRTATSDTDLSALTTWILDHLGDPITLADLVHESGWSAAQLTRLTRRDLDLAPMQYVTRLRIRRAERLLADTELGVSQVAHLVGFHDPLHFSRRFSQVAGQSPSSVRKGAR